ncbi:MAG: UvrD-helicase domain-containing protein [Eubacteriales bacterium]|nr:UvrD-helicase domain-containing protein [Eubacteriales bacterium]MDD3199285.1 UvrD-helicase domain-containing protein [Eubacteriales bacterium]MDD4629415.1 UvrD-helicase domain-containing protein [Eubacteriales bacterium]
MDYLDKLNPQQKEAAIHKNGPMLILAGAGSGKTSTMTHRIAYLIKEEGVSPYNIFAVTFTNKAAQEMRDRVEDLIGGGLNMWILTFHSACLRILRKNAEYTGYNKDFIVYDPTDQKVVIKSCIKEHNVDDKKFPPAYVLSIISDCKEKGISPQDYSKINGSDFKNKIIYDIYSAYSAVLKKNNAMDFDDLILRTVELFEKNDEILTYYQQKFRYIMVDEYQDTNLMQYRFVKLLAKEHNNICVVGDDDQCIYQWRGADIRNILEFEKDFKNTKVIKLEQNYRSHGNILAAAHSVIENNKGRKHKKLWTDKEKGEKIKYYRADNEKDEARYIAQEIDRLNSRELPYCGFAVLYRTNVQSRTFEEALSAREIPYRVLGGTRYYDRKEIKDIMAYMRLVQNTADDLSLTRIINEPKRGIGEKTLEKLRVLASVRNESLFDTLSDDEIVEGLSSKAAEGVREMISVISQFSGEKDNLRVSDIYDGLLVQTGYLKNLELQNTVESEGRIENLLEFKSVIFDYENEDPKLSLSEFMEKVALLAEIDNHDAGENAVVLMTLHSAKGLEFPVVFMPGMEDGLFPGWRAFEKPDGIEEERRLCYVGMTRAMQRLYMTSAELRTLYGKTDYTKESQFLKELDKSLIDGDAIYEKKHTSDRNLGWSQGGGNDGYSNPEIFRPFEQLKYIKQNRAAGSSNSNNTGSDLSDLKEGDKVIHSKFGEGLVLSLDRSTVSVAFDSVGVKKLARDIAPIKKV